MPYKVGGKSKKGWPIMKKEAGKWKIVGWSKTKGMAQSSIRARYASEK